MSYRISIYNSIAEEIRDTINEQNDKAIRSLNNHDISIDKRIHDARKRFKKIRAALRLVRYCLPKKTYTDMNTLYRDFGREFAPLRDSLVKVKTLKKLVAVSHKEHSYKYRSFEELLKVNYSKTKDIFEKKDIPTQIIEKLDDQSDKILELPLKHESPNQVVKGIKKIYKQGKSAYTKALKKPTSENIHEWRKRVKYLWYHTRLIRDIWKPVIKGYRNSLDEVSDYLGDRHDIDVLLHDLGNTFDLSNDAYNELIKTSDIRKTRLTEKAFIQGGKHYLEKPKVFSQRLLKCWEMEMHEEMDSKK